jgi:hypothetical protein
MDPNLEEVLRSCVPVFFLGTREPWQATAELSCLGRNLGMDVCVYSPGEGLKRKGQKWDNTDPLELLDEILVRHVRDPDGDPTPVLWILQMFDLFLHDPDPMVLSRIGTLNERLRFNASVALLVEPGFRPPSRLEGLPFLERKLPDKDFFLEMVQSDMETYSAEEKNDMAQALCGCTRREAETLLCLSMARTGRMDSGVIRDLKGRRIRKQGGHLLEFMEEDLRLEDVGGMNDLIAWVKIREAAFRAPSRLVNYRLSPPRGVFLLGVPGCGKSLLARAIAGSWGVPLVKLNAGDLFTAEVGGSEKRLSLTLDTVRAVAPCVLLLDEMEKGFSPVSGFSDGGTAQRIQAALLGFLQDRPGPIFVVATGNGTGALAPEWMRRGRWDEIFFIDLPAEEERRQILKVLFRRHQLDLPVDPECVRFSEGYSGAEMEQAIRDTIYEECIFSGRPFHSLALLRHLRDLVPLSKMREREIWALRTWAASHARPAQEKRRTEAMSVEKKGWPQSLPR